MQAIAVLLEEYIVHGISPRLLGDGVKIPDIKNVYTAASPTAASGPELLLENQGYPFLLQVQ